MAPDTTDFVEDVREPEPGFLKRDEVEPETTVIP
jgi:hypothetical protein